MRGDGSFEAVPFSSLDMEERSPTPFVTDQEIKMTRKRTLMIAAGVLLAAGGVAAVSAQGQRGWRGGDGMGMEEFDGPGGGRGHGFFRRGELTEAESAARARERFARLDKNSDGVIDASEIEAALTDRMGKVREHMGMQPGERILRRFDENRDGKVTRDEFNNTVRKIFAEFDLNNDGKITDDDLPPMMRGRGVLSDAGAGALPGGPGRHAGGRGGMLLGLLRGADANRDGVITLDEVMAQAGKMFAQLDRNKDNVVDKADFDSLRQEMVDYRVKRFVHHFGADKDGKVTREQFEKVAKERFAMGDLDNDGKISRDERPGRGGRGRRGDGEHGPGEHRGRGPMTGPDGDHGAGPGMGGPGTGGPGRN